MSSVQAPALKVHEVPLIEANEDNLEGYGRLFEDPARQELLHALQNVANSLGSSIIAEGLDTLEELATLGDLGIRYGQGWLFGHPNPLRSDLDEP